MKPNADSKECDEESIGDVEFKGNGGQSSVFGATVNMSKTIVGAGVFGLPMAYNRAGFVSVTILIIIMAFFISWTLTTLLRAGLRCKTIGYHELVIYI
jgi:amino acid permease